MVAHYYFQMFFCGNKNTDELCVIPNAGAKEAWELISEHKNMFDMYKKEHYIMMSLIRLLVSKKSAFDCNLESLRYHCITFFLLGCNGWK